MVPFLWEGARTTKKAGLDKKICNNPMGVLVWYVLPDLVFMSIQSFFIQEDL